jgi:acyl-CoA thioesterase I
LRLALSLSGFIMVYWPIVIWSTVALGADASVPNANANATENVIPVATAAGVILWTPKQYNENVEPLGRLPTLAKSYVFGHTIPTPKTDNAGHILLSKSSPAKQCSAGEESPGAAPPSGSQILAFGDSLTAGLGLPPAAAFPAQLESRLRSQGIAVAVINGGVSGETTAEGLPRLDRALADRPGFVLLELGANDALRGVDPMLVQSNLRAIIVKIKSSGAKVLLAGMLAPPNWGEEYRREFDRIYPELARTCGVPLYPFFLSGVAGHAEFNQPDGLHPNAQGVAVLVDRIAPVVGPLLAGGR